MVEKTQDFHIWSRNCNGIWLAQSQRRSREKVALAADIWAVTV